MTKMAKWVVELERKQRVRRRFIVTAEYEGEAIEKAAKRSGDDEEGWRDAWIDRGSEPDEEGVVSVEEVDEDDEDEEDEDE